MKNHDHAVIDLEPSDYDVVEETIGANAVRNSVIVNGSDRWALLDKGRLEEEQVFENLEYYKHGNIIVEPAEAAAELTPTELVERMETDHAVKTAPRWEDQLRDPARMQSITFIGRSQVGLGPETSKNAFRDRRDSLTEYEAMTRTDGFFRALKTAADSLDMQKQSYNVASMRENLTFIGKKEYEEAAAGIATYWKALLERNPNQQIVAIASVVSQEYGDTANDVKSDQYMLENVLANFTDDELQRYAGRLVTDFAQVTVESADDLRIVLLEDWTISGQQLKDAVETIVEMYPHLASSVEIQLIAANEQRIAQGLNVHHTHGYAATKAAVPVRAYYRAHAGEYGKQSSAHITGAHSSVDFDFEDDLTKMKFEVEREGHRQSLPQPEGIAELPPLTNVVRPYRMPGYTLRNTARLIKANNGVVHA